MVRTIVLRYAEKEFKKLEKIKEEVAEISGMKSISWENFVLDQIVNNN